MVPPVIVIPVDPAPYAWTVPLEVLPGNMRSSHAELIRSNPKHETKSTKLVAQFGQLLYVADTKRNTNVVIMYVYCRFKLVQQ